jgi:signal transduction histidine kinase
MPKKLFQELRIISNCKKYDLTLWECPQFLFLLMGGINILSCLISYLLGERYIRDPRLVALLVLGVAFILLIIAYVITQSLERLAEASRIKGEFINIVSHQLRAPLTNLKWAVEFLITKNGQKLEGKEEEYYEIIRENSKRLENLLNDLLIVAKIKEDGLFRLKETVDLSKLIKKVVNDYQSFAEASNVKINLELPNQPIILKGNEELFKTIIENLLSNAIVYNKKGGKVEIKIEEKPKKVLVAIQDTGMGISKEDQKFIFEKFFRGRNAFQVQAQGTGLGLYIVKMILERLKGKVWFQTKEGEGTTFYFTLPIK